LKRKGQCQKFLHYPPLSVIGAGERGEKAPPTPRSAFFAAIHAVNRGKKEGGKKRRGRKEDESRQASDGLGRRPVLLGRTRKKEDEGKEREAPCALPYAACSLRSGIRGMKRKKKAEKRKDAPHRPHFRGRRKKKKKEKKKDGQRGAHAPSLSSDRRSAPRGGRKRKSERREKSRRSPRAAISHRAGWGRREKEKGEGTSKEGLNVTRYRELFREGYKKRTKREE